MSGQEGLSRAQAYAALVQLGFGRADAQKMTTLNPLDRAVSRVVASGLTDDEEVQVRYSTGTRQYAVETRRRPPGPAPCMWRKDYEDASSRFRRAEDRLTLLRQLLADAEHEYDEAEAWLRQHEERPGVPLPQCRQVRGADA